MPRYSCGTGSDITLSDQDLGYYLLSTSAGTLLSLDTTNLPDGSYTLVATAFDGSYTSSEVEKNFDVDNTSPVLILTQPNSTDINDPFASGSTVVITGEIGDDHSISYVEVEIYKYDAATGTAEETPMSFDLVDKDGNPFTTDKLVYENVNISGGTTITLAALNENATTVPEQNLNRIYNKLYEGVETKPDGYDNWLRCYEWHQSHK